MGLPLWIGSNSLSKHEAFYRRIRTALPSGLTHWWPCGGDFTDRAGVRGTAIYGTVGGTVATPAGSGPVNYPSARFGGADTDIVTLSGNVMSSCGTTGNFTIAGWVLIRDTSVSPDGAGTNPVFFTFSDGTNNCNIQHSFNTQPGAVGIAAGPSNTNDPSSAHQTGVAVPTAVLKSNVWCHLAFTKAGSIASNTLYLNGLSTALLSNATYACGLNNVFSSRNGTIRPINGSLAHVMTWDRALSATEALALYSAVSTPLQLGLGPMFVSGATTGHGLTESILLDRMSLVA